MPAALTLWLHCHPKILHQESIGIGLFGDDLAGCRPGSVAGRKANPQENRRGAGLGELQGGGKLEGVGRHDSRVVVAGDDERGRVAGAGTHVVIW